MSRSLWVTSALVLLVSTSCEKCKRCSYTYTQTSIIQTINGEVEQTDTLSAVLYDEDGLVFSEECIKNDQEFTIEQAYQIKKDTTVLENFNFVCEDL
jgi:hypothetical protein